MRISTARGVRYGGLALVLSIGLAGCAGSPDGGNTAGPGGGLEDLEEMTLTISMYNAATSATGAPTEAFADYITEKTDGKVTFEIFSSGALLPGGETMEGIESGLADIGMVSGFWYAAQDLPLTVETGPLNTGLMEGMLAENLHHNLSSHDFGLSEWAQDELREHNQRALMSFSGVPFRLFCTEPAETLDDLRGRLTLALGDSFSQQVSALGMVPVLLATTDVYEGFQRGVIDCAASLRGSMASNGNYAVAGHEIDSVVFSSAGLNYLTINNDVWESFPDELKRIFQEAGHVWLTEYLVGTFKEAQLYLDLVESGDITYSTAVGSAEVLAEFHKSIRDSMLANPPAGVEPEALEALFNTYEEWESILTDLGYESNSELDLDMTFPDNLDDILEILKDRPYSLD